MTKEKLERFEDRIHRGEFYDGDDALELCNALRDTWNEVEQLKGAMGYLMPVVDALDPNPHIDIDGKKHFSVQELAERVMRMRDVIGATRGLLVALSGLSISTDIQRAKDRVFDALDALNSLES